MGKRAVFARFVALAALLVVGAALLGARTSETVANALVGVAILLVLVLAWGTFSPNAPLFGRVVAGGGTRRRAVALTFDDGPSADHTPAVLDVLREHGVRATFFVLGRHVRAHPEIARRIVEEGHELASHGDDHALLAFAGPTEVARQVRAAAESVVRAVGHPPAPFFRAPHGFRSPFVVPVLKRLGYQAVGWNGSVFDTARPGAEVIAARCRDLLRPGAILLLHDADGSGQGGDRSQTVAALPAVIAAARERGLELLSVSQLAGELRPRRRRALRAGLFALAVGVIVIVVARKFQLRVIADVFTSANPALVGAAVIANFCSVAAKALTWKAAIDAVPGERRRAVRLAEVIPALFIGFLLNTVLFARLGEVARLSVLRRKLAARREHVPVSTLLGTIVTEQLLLGVTLVLVLAGIVATVHVPSWAFGLLVALICAVLFIALAVAALEIYERVRHRPHPGEDYVDVERWWNLLGISLSAVTVELRRGQAIFRRPRLLAWGLVTGTASWLAQIAGINWALQAYGIHEGVGAAGLVFLASTLVGLFPIVPGNLVVFQGATAAVLTVTYNVPASDAVPFSIGLQLIEAILGVGVGFFFLSSEGLSLRELRREAEQEEEQQTTAMR